MNDAFTGMLIVLVVAGLLGLVIYLIHQLVKSKNELIQNLVAERDVLREELDNLKSRKRIRQTQATEAGILDARANLIRAKLELEDEEDRRLYVNRLLDRCMETLGEIREGPYRYDPNKPCVQREETPNG